MYMRAFVVRFAFIGVLSVGIAVSAAFRQPLAQPAAPKAVPTQAAVATPAALPVVTLSTVHVHADTPKAAAKPDAANHAISAAAPVSLTSASEHRGGGMGPTLRLDMPYYSFGKILPRVGKE